MYSIKQLMFFPQKSVLLASGNSMRKDAEFCSTFRSDETVAHSIQNAETYQMESLS